MSPIRIQSIDHVVFRVTDLQRALRFYRDVLGCALERERPDIGLYHLRAGSAMIDLVPIDGKLGAAGGESPDRGRPNVDHICLQLDSFDADAIRAHLAGHGIDAGDVASRFGAGGEGPSLYIRDPDGNGIELKGPPGTV